MFKVLDQTIPPGGVYPVATVTDDRERFPPDTVRQVLAWLEAESAVHLALRKPTDQILGQVLGYQTVNPVTAKIFPHLVGGNVTDFNRVHPSGQATFLQRTYQAFIKLKADPLPVCCHHYLGAIEPISKMVIVRKEILWTEPLRPMP